MLYSRFTLIFIRIRDRSAFFTHFIGKFHVLCSQMFIARERAERRNEQKTESFISSLPPLPETTAVPSLSNFMSMLFYQFDLNKNFVELEISEINLIETVSSLSTNTVNSHQYLPSAFTSAYLVFIEPNFSYISSKPLEKKTHVLSPSLSHTHTNTSILRILPLRDIGRFPISTFLKYKGNVFLSLFYFVP